VCVGIGSFKTIQAKTGQNMATAKNKGEAPGRGREVMGIGLLGLGVFCAVSLCPCRPDAGRLMGPGGAAAATGLYSLIGLCAYPLVAGVLLLAFACAALVVSSKTWWARWALWHCCVQRPSFSTFPLPASRLPCAARAGMLGQWLAETGASAVAAWARP